jgi:L-alanine-DL-glutamate epimerase-like enolase superfamily enzyme
MAAPTIESLETIPIRIPFDHWAPPPLFAGKPRNGVEMLLVRITTSNGIVGWGEAYGGGWPGNVVAFDTWVRPLVVGQSATDADLTTRLERTLHNLGRSGAVIQALSGVDIALWDIRGKLEGVSVSTLLGGVRRKRVELYASLLQYSGKVDDVRRTADTVAAAREITGPDIPIMVDTNCAWTPEQAMAAVLAMAPSKPFWIEEPIWPPEDFESAAALKRATGVPLAMGENATGVLDYRKMVAAGATDFVQPSIVKIGGLTNLWRIATQAEKDGVVCVPNAFFLGPGYLATLHALAAKERVSTIERFFADLGYTPYAKTVPIAEGAIEVPEGPGLGADPEPELVERYRIAH